MTLSTDQQNLVNRISAMSADQFNACVAARYDYQRAFDAWIEYQEEVDFDFNDADPLPDADILLDVVDKDVLKRIRKKMKAAIVKAKQAGKTNDDEGIRQDVFTEYFSDVLKADLLSTHKVSNAMYDDIAAMDEEVYHGPLRWSLIQGAGKDLDIAGRMTEEG